MSAPIKHGSVALPSDAAEEPRPWQSAEDVRRWKSAGRVRTAGRRPRVSITVDLDDEQSEWIREEALRTHENPAQLLKRLVDAARAASTAPGPRRDP
jgi:hypothetical protein